MLECYLFVSRQRSGHRGVDEDLDIDDHQGSRQRRRVTTSSTELYTVDDLPRVTHLNDAEVTPCTQQL